MSKTSPGAPLGLFTKHLGPAHPSQLQLMLLTIMLSTEPRTPRQAHFRVDRLRTFRYCD